MMGLAYITSANSMVYLYPGTYQLFSIASGLPGGGRLNLSAASNDVQAAAETFITCPSNPVTISGSGASQLGFSSVTVSGCDLIFTAWPTLSSDVSFRFLGRVSFLAFPNLLSGCFLRWIYP